ncbi:hypothetical protein [Zavarzinella formosa]|uniref:hypothetical protein n=1 Tax=Zavarzinella formosa TaxID=360055 RepID=UPI000373BC6C|nr:hypothetical protein [Zavarzinella formosa]
MTNDRQVKAAAEALWNKHKADMGEAWYAPSETWHGVPESSRQDFYEDAKTAIAASDAQFVPMLASAIKESMTHQSGMSAYAFSSLKWALDQLPEEYRS